MNEPGLNSYLATRNLWNIYMLNYNYEQALERFSQVIRETEPDKLSELDIADALRALAHFQHMDYDCLEVLLKQSIKRADKFKLQTLAVVLNAYAELEIVNPTLLTIAKQTILARIDRNEVTIDGEPSITGEIPSLKPVDCSMFMAAFSRAE